MPVNINKYQYILWWQPGEDKRASTQHIYAEYTEICMRQFADSISDIVYTRLMRVLVPARVSCTHGSAPTKLLESLTKQSR